jgi:hypothetical protein
MRNQQAKASPANASFTKLVDKHFSPMVIRKTTTLGFPIFIGIITDDDISDFDDVIMSYIEENKEGWTDNIQKMRNFAGGLVECLNTTYKRTEGSAVVVYADKCFISALHGDLMCHAACKTEFFELLNMSTGV